MNKGIKRFIIFFLILNIFLLIISGAVFAGTESTDINGIDENQYPGIKAKIQALKSAHPNWNFKVEYTDLSWEEVINGEHQNHGALNNPTNLVTNTSSSYAGMWVCEICGKEKCDSGSWYCASTEALKYMMDPRNSINSTDVFQFLQLSASGNYTNDNTVRNVLKNMAKTTTYIDDECITAILKAATDYHVDPYYIMAKIIGEQGTTGSTAIYGTGYNGSYAGFYNFFNIGATGSNKNSVIQQGLNYAERKGWNTKTKSILGGVDMISKNYIAKEQDTLYYQKFNVVGNNRYQHQYQQNILAAQNEGTSLQKLYKKMDGSLSGNYYTFIIPLYKNMPATASPRPSTTNSYTISSVRMGDTNGDGSVNIADIISVINHIKGAIPLSGNNLTAAKVTGNSDVTVADVVLLINYLKGSAVLPSSGFTTATLKSSTGIRLAPNGSIYSNISAGTSVKVISEATTQINWAYWDLVVTPKGLYGYIDRNSYK